MTTIAQIKTAIENAPITGTFPAWNKGVRAYALEILEGAEYRREDFQTWEPLKNALLDGAETIRQYAEGNSLVYCVDIIARLTPEKLEDWKNNKIEVDTIALQEFGLFEAFCEIKTYSGLEA